MRTAPTVQRCNTGPLTAPPPAGETSGTVTTWDFSVSEGITKRTFVILVCATAPDLARTRPGIQGACLDCAGCGIDAVAGARRYAASAQITSTSIPMMSNAHHGE